MICGLPIVLCMVGWALLAGLGSTDFASSLGCFVVLVLYLDLNAFGWMCVGFVVCGLLCCV